jgi:hypothetical protein
MKPLLTLALVGALGVISQLGCGTAAPTDATAAASPAIDGSKYLLTDEPEDAVGVIEARESAQDGAPVVIVGRIGGADNPWVEGRAAFMLIDASMAVVAAGEECAEGELCTGDCCATEMTACTTLVKVVDAEGRIVAADSRRLLGVNADDTVVVRGKAQKDDSGNFVVLAEGVHVRR